jgi:hypothetical protein
MLSTIHIDTGFELNFERQSKKRQTLHTKKIITKSFSLNIHENKKQQPKTPQMDRIIAQVCWPAQPVSGEEDN